MPTRLLVIGVLFCLAGVFAVVQTLIGFSNSRYILNLSVFLLPVGIGLLQGKESSRWWAGFWIVLGYIGCGLMFVLVIVNPANTKLAFFSTTIHGSAAAPYAILAVVFSAALFFFVHMLLCSQVVTDYIEAKQRRDDVLDR